MGIAEQIRLKRHPGRLRQPADAVHIRGHLHHGQSGLPALPLHQGTQPGPLHLVLIAERHRHAPGIIRRNKLIPQRVQQIGTAVQAQFHPAAGLPLAENPPLHRLLLRQTLPAHITGNLKQGSLPVPDIILHIMRLRPIQIKPGRLIIHRAINILIRAGVKTVPAADHLQGAILPPPHGNRRGIALPCPHNRIHHPGLFIRPLLKLGHIRAKRQPGLLNKPLAHPLLNLNKRPVKHP